MTMNSPFGSHNRFFLAALLFEGGLGVVALVAGWLVDQPPLRTIQLDVASRHETAAALLVGVIGALPMMAALLVLDRYPLGPLRGLQRFVESHLVPLFAPLSSGQLLLISLVAGMGEEMLFRGFVQAGLARWIGPPLGAAVGLSAASLVFGLCHWLTPAYAAVAALVGAYLGCLYLATDNLLAPIVTHAAYDFLALLYLVKWKRSPSADTRATSEQETTQATPEQE